MAQNNAIMRGQARTLGGLSTGTIEKVMNRGWAKGSESSLQGRVLMLVAQLGLFATPWTIAHQAPLSMEFSRQKY